MTTIGEAPAEQGAARRGEKIPELDEELVQCHRPAKTPGSSSVLLAGAQKANRPEGWAPRHGLIQALAAPTLVVIHRGHHHAHES